MIYGIHPGCTLALLLFILEAVVLALAIQKDVQITVITVPQEDGAEHKFSAFVDDSTVFMQDAQHK